MKRIILTVSALLISGSIFAQTGMTNDAVYQGLGGKAGIQQIVVDFIPLIQSDERIKSFFEKTDTAKLTMLLTEQFCQLTGGPCEYSGRDMKTTHEGMGIGIAQFNALAEDLQVAMEKNHIATSVQNKLIARLAPMQRAIVEK